jgi:hypothetical protein
MKGISDFGCRISGDLRAVASFGGGAQHDGNLTSAAKGLRLSTNHPKSEIRNPKSEILL